MQKEEGTGVPERRRRASPALHLTGRVGQEGNRRIGPVEPQERSCRLVGNRGTLAEYDIDRVDVDGVGVVLGFRQRLGLGRRPGVPPVLVAFAVTVVVMATGAVMVVAVGVPVCGRGWIRVEMRTAVMSRGFAAAVAVAEPEAG